ncbi:hypothetical protein SFOMI_2790 [Sphingobium fuliginis]|uniref:Uncharacterized protein n=1 Tax=Sphingobium fuliginis (strain ATCC 27551) TaxID=336203 RepID=A0A292ZH65_SPHSA|nr:hypothetical protein SFOMI_2790 [Sphingobium fuliginis]
MVNLPRFSQCRHAPASCPRVQPRFCERRRRRRTATRLLKPMPSTMRHCVLRLNPEWEIKLRKIEII